jgi:GPH family glycoside/pentoside/hexuronide:cation symporter
MAAFFAPVLVAACWWCAIQLKEIKSAAVKTRLTFGAALRSVAANRPFMILLGAYTISAIGSNLPATLILYYVEYVLLSERAEVFLLIYFATGIVMLPAWIRLSARTGKKHAWIAAMALNTGAFIGVFFLGPGDELPYAVLVFLSGMGFGATLALPSAIQADVIDYDELKTGQRREGLYMGMWSISKKLAAALGVGAGLYVLGWAGYQPRAAQSETVIWALRVLYALVPSICNIAAMLIVWRYPISGSVHRQIRATIEHRKAAAAQQNCAYAGCELG